MTEPAEDDQLQQLARYEEGALLFLRAGGRLTLAEFTALPPLKQLAAARAGDKFTFAMAALYGFAALGPKHAMAVLARADGGKAQATASLGDVVQEVLREGAAFARGGG